MGQVSGTTRKERKVLSWGENRVAILSTPEEIEEFQSLFPETIDYNSPDCEEGDVVVDIIRNFVYRFSVYKCPYCEKKYPTIEAFKAHAKAVQEEYLLAEEEADIPEHPPVKPDEYEEVLIEHKFSKALVYYAVVNPREIISPPPSVEYSEERRKVPTAEEREKHDQEVAKWREELVKTCYVRKPKIDLLPNGDLHDAGGRRWWYWTVQVWDNERRRWRPMETIERNNPRGKTRVLYLLAIIPEEEE
jgi:hypothetical protein